MPTKIKNVKEGTENIQPHLLHRNKVWTKSFIIAVIILIALGTVSLLTGAYNIFEKEGFKMIFITRIPRTASLMLTGAAMSWLAW